MAAIDLSSLSFDALVGREWLCALGNGGYASSTPVGLNSRKYHGLLVAAMSPPVRRMVLLSRVEETVRCAGRSFDLACNEYPGAIYPHGNEFLRAFAHTPFVRWAYQGDGWTVEKQLRPLRGRNAVILAYSLLGGQQEIDLELRPLFALRGIHELMYQWNAKLDAQKIGEGQWRIPATTRSPEVFFAHDGSFSQQPGWYLNTIYRRERQRGYSGLEDLWMPGVVRWKLAPGQTVHFICSAEPVNLVTALRDAARQYEDHSPAQPQDRNLAALLHAADAFVVRSREGLTTITTAYPWAAPSLRDALISMTGLLLVPNRLDAARELLSSIAATLRNGLVASDLSEAGAGYLYQSADVSLWFIHAAGQYLRYAGDERWVCEELLPVIDAILEAHRIGTDLGIGIDDEGLLITGLPNLATTWMNAQSAGSPITPRVGRAVEINALWYNALRTASILHRRTGDSAAADRLDNEAARMKSAFDKRFWNASAGCCFDVVGDSSADAAIRPNQLLAVSLPYSVLDETQHRALLDKILAELLTPVGVRTLARSDSAYHPQYAGPPDARDLAHHQGSAFAWLLGPLVSAYVKVHGRSDFFRQEALSLLNGCTRHLHEAGIGQICELFDGDPPHTPGGDVASARSIGELLRAYVEDVLDIRPETTTPRPDALTVGRQHLQAAKP